MRRSLLFALASLFGAPSLLIGCPATLDGRCSDDACDATAYAQQDGADGNTADVVVTDPCIDQPTSESCIDESAALFVSAAADPASAAGTRANPFKTIGEALAKVSDAKKRIYVCSGSYPEAVSVSRAGLSLIGGLACDWKTKGDAPHVEPAKGIALTVSVSSDIAITDFEFAGIADSQTKGASAIGALVSGSQNVLLRRVQVRAGPAVGGGGGADGSTMPNYSGGLAPSGVNKTDASAGGSPAPMCGVCGDGTFSTGGAGSTYNGMLAASGGAKPAVGSANAGGSGGTCTNGTDGAQGNAPAKADGAPRPGTITQGGWDASKGGSDGTNGNPGQGGGGGGAAGGTGGGSGGCGGCGGTGGKGGQNGGSSIALLAYQTDVVLQDCILAASDGGAGGTGGIGQDAQLRGGGGSGACLGGPGGFGAGGAGGGGGAGGHSIGFGYSNSKPSVQNTTFSTAMPGMPGKGGMGGGSSGHAGPSGSDGAPGTKADSTPLD